MRPIDLVDGLIQSIIVEQLDQWLASESRTVSVRAAGDARRFRPSVGSRKLVSLRKPMVQSGLERVIVTDQPWQILHQDGARGSAKSLVERPAGISAAYTSDINVD